MVIGGFFQSYFLDPLYAGDAAYNVFNTTVYALLLVAGVFGVYKLLRYLKIEIDTRFFIATVPFIFLSSILRVLRDAEIFTTLWLVSPLIYILMFGVTFTILTATIFLEKKKIVKYHFASLGVGLALILFFGFKLWIHGFSNTSGAVLIVIFTVVTASVGIGFFKLIEHKIVTPVNQIVIFAALFDAASTFVGVTYYGYVEKHVIPAFFFDLFGGAWIMFLLKFVVITAALWAIDEFEDDVFLRHFLKFAILAVTLGPGARNTLRILGAT